jgi:hypothetical protein
MGIIVNDVNEPVGIDKMLINKKISIFNLHAGTIYPLKFSLDLLCQDLIEYLLHL